MRDHKELVIDWVLKLLNIAFEGGLVPRLEGSNDRSIV